MESDEEHQLSSVQSKQYALLRSDLAAALAAFDRAQDWADLIHDLQRVNRVLNKNAATHFLPGKALLAKRLSQCLTTSLPSGVHLKALETYHQVFKRIGPVRLARDLPFYAAGLFPLFAHCSTSLKAPLLSLYETHFLPLGVALCPVLDGFVLAVLPGVEDESSEFFVRSTKLLQRLAEAVGDFAVFARALWRALLLSPPMRLAAANFLRAKLSEGDGALCEEIVMDMPLVAYAITAALSDDDALTQRSVLDLLLGERVLDSKFFQRGGKEEREAAVAVVGGLFGALIRRDMSLTKRVHAWLLGGKVGDEGIAFCRDYSSELVLAAIDSEFASLLEGLGGKNATFATRPCRIASALMDRTELAECLGHHFALRVLKYGMAAIGKNNHEHERDIRHAVSEFLQDLGSAKVFAELERMLASKEDKSHENFELLTFALSMFPTKIEVVRTQHLPALLRVAVNSLTAVSADSLTLDKAVAFCGKAVQSMALSTAKEVDDEIRAIMEGTVAAFASFFVAWLAQVVETAPVELRRAYADVSVTDEYAAELKVATVHETRKECISLAKSACLFFVTVGASGVAGGDSLRAALQATAKCASSADVRISLAGTRAFTEISSKLGLAETQREGHEEQVFGVVRRCWRQMHPSLRTATPQSAHAFLGLQRRFPEEAKIVIADGILSTDLPRRLRNLERFACLWRLAVEHRLMPLPADDGLFLMLDALTDEDWAPKMLARSWLSDALEIDAPAVLDAPLRLLLTAESRTTGQQHEFAAAYDAPRALYGFQILRGILESCTATGGSAREHGNVSQPSARLSTRDVKRGQTGILALSSVGPSARTNQALVTVFALHEEQTKESEELIDLDAGSEGPVKLSKLLPVQNYVIAIALTCLGYLRGQVPSRYTIGNEEIASFEKSMNNRDGRSKDLDSIDMDDDDMAWLLAGLGFKSLEELHASVCAAGAECLATLFQTIPVPSQMSAVLSGLFAKPVLALVQQREGSTDAVLQLHLLNSIAFLVTADGPTYLSSIHGKETFAKSDTRRVRLSYAESQNQLHAVRQAGQMAKTVQVGAVESLKDFIPWLLTSVSAICRKPNMELDGGSREVLGVRRRWIQFIETVVQHIGVTMPVATEGLLLVFLVLLSLHNRNAKLAAFSGDSEFARVDETLILLEGLSVILSNILWSFEYALASGGLDDDSQSQTVSAIGKVAQMSPAVVNDAFINVDAENRRPSDQSTNGAMPSGSHRGQTGASGQPDRTVNVTAATAAVINAINPIRMFNDFVKDVLIGTGSDGTNRLLDPRRASARLMFCLMPDVMRNIAVVWGPATLSYVSESAGNENVKESKSPRLSMELPRERRQSQRAAVLNILGPVFELRPVDVIAAVIALFSVEQNEYGSINEAPRTETPAQMACHALQALKNTNPGVVVSAVKTVFENAVKWDASGAEAKEGAGQALLRRKALSAVQSLVESGSDGLNDEALYVIGRMGLGESGSSLPGGTVGLGVIDGIQGGVGLAISKHDGLFHWGDYFAIYDSGRIETACLNFLEYFMRSSPEASDIHSSFGAIHGTLKDVLSSGKRRATTPALVKALGTFVARCPCPFPDRRNRKDVMTLAVLCMSACSGIASCSTDVSTDEHKGNPKDFKKQLSIVALEALASALPVLVDSTFLEDKPQLSSTVASSLSPATSTLRKAASRANAIKLAADSSARSRGTSTERTSRQVSEQALDISASKAAADVLLNVSRRDWGIKFARRDLLTLLEDSNFFFGKEGGVLEKVSAIVREVVAGGGAASVLASIGSAAAGGPPGIPSIFTGRDSETVLRGRAIRRVAFCVFVSEPDFYSPQLPAVLERLRDALRIADAGLVVECLLCLRALLLKTGPSSISAFRATTLSELFRIASNPTDHLEASIAALKFLDLTTLLSPADYGFERCFFFGEEMTDSNKPGSELKAFKPLAHTLSALWTTENREEEDVFAPPLRLQRGRTVLPGSPPVDFNQEFVGRYAAALMMRNSMPKMKPIAVDTQVICAELEREFLM